MTNTTKISVNAKISKLGNDSLIQDLWVTQEFLIHTSDDDGMYKNYYKQIQKNVEYFPNQLVDNLENTEDTISVFDLYVLLVHLFADDSQRSGCR